MQEAALVTAWVPGAALPLALEMVGNFLRGEQPYQWLAQQFLLIVAEHPGENPVHVGDRESRIQDADALVGGLHDAPVAFLAVLQLCGLDNGLALIAHQGEPQQGRDHRHVEPALDRADPDQHVGCGGEKNPDHLVGKQYPQCADDSIRGSNPQRLQTGHGFRRTLG